MTAKGTLILCSLVAFPALFIPAAILAQGAGVAEGTVVNGTTGAPAAGIAVTVQVFSRMTQTEERAAATDGQGRFRLDGLPAGTDNRYILSVLYSGVKYGLPAAINPNDSQPPPVLTVYETTASSEAVSILSTSTAITSVDAGTGLIQALEAVTVSNRGKAAYVGGLLSGAADDGVLRLPLPGAALDLELGDGFTEMPAATSGMIVTRTPLFPGQTVFVFAYKLPYDQASYLLRRTYGYPIERAAIVVPASGPKAISGVLTTAETATIDGKLHYSLSRTKLAPGEEISVTLSGLPPLSAPSAKGLGLDTAMRGAGIALMSLALLAVGMYILVPRGAPGRLQPLPAADALLAERRRLVAAVAELDQRYEAGVLSRQYYEDARPELMGRLKDVALLVLEREQQESRK